VGRWLNWEDDPEMLLLNSLRRPGSIQQLRAYVFFGLVFRLIVLTHGT